MKQSTKDRILSETPDEVKYRVDLLVNKEETFEEAAEKYPYCYASYGSQRKAFTDGAKWQQERSYSEEEVVNILMKVYEDIGKRKIPNPVVLAEWFNKFKKL